MGILTRLAREGMVMRSLVFPTGLVVGTLLVTLGVLAWSRGPDTVAMLADDPALAMVEEAGFTVVVSENPRASVEQGQTWAGVDGQTIMTGTDGLEFQRLEAFIRKDRGSSWRPAAEIQRPTTVQSQPIALQLTRILAILFTLYGVVFGAGMMARDREDGTLDAELALPIPSWVPAMARFIAATVALAAFFAGGTWMMDAVLDLAVPGNVLLHGAASASAATAFGIAAASRSTLKSGFTTTLAVSMTGVSALSALGGAVPASRWLPVASLWGEGPTLAPLAIALCMGAASSIWFASRQR